MNMSSLDVTDIPSAVRGDTVIAISRNPSDQNSVEQMATLAGTTPYVILVHIPQHLKRVVE
jgi:alanine racemase